jgi:hypothetical protein
MSVKSLFALPALLVLAATTTESVAQRSLPVEAGGAYTVSAGPLSATIGASRGARIRSLKFDGTELFYTDSSGGAPTSHGSTFWPGPQAHWTSQCRTNNNNGCWPPPVNLDGNTSAAIYTGGLRNDSSVSYVSNLDNGTGVRLRKTIWANVKDSSIGIRYHIVNGGSAKSAYSPWEVTRFTTGGLLFWQKDPTDTIKGNGNPGLAMIAMVRDTLGTKWFKYDSATVPTSGTAKLWDGSTGGWFARVDKSRLLYIKKFTDTPKSKKPPVNENEIEIYSANRSGTTGGMNLLEMELHGPFDSIAVGDSAAWDVKWYVRRLPDSIPVTANAALLAYVNRVASGPVALSSSKPQHARSALAFSNRRASFELSRAAVVSLSLVDAGGRTVRDLYTGPARAGRHEFAVTAPTPGIYWLTLKNGAEVRIRRVALL